MSCRFPEFVITNQIRKTIKSKGTCKISSIYTKSKSIQTEIDIYLTKQKKKNSSSFSKSQCSENVWEKLNHKTEEGKYKRIIDKTLPDNHQKESQNGLLQRKNETPIEAEWNQIAVSGPSNRGHLCI
jgi:hypothetical protein